MTAKYIVVRSNSTSGPFIVERATVGVENWTKADVAGYCDTKREAVAIAKYRNTHRTLRVRGTDIMQEYKIHETARAAWRELHPAHNPVVIEFENIAGYACVPSGQPLPVGSYKSFVTVPSARGPRMVACEAQT